MLKILGTLSALALLTAAGTANAADASGKITKIGTSSITLSDGQIYTMAKGLSAKGLKAGDLVKVTYRKQGGKMLVTKVVPAMKSK